MLALWNAQPIPLGRSLFNWGERSKILLGSNQATLFGGGFRFHHQGTETAPCSVKSTCKGCKRWATVAAHGFSQVPARRCHVFVYSSSDRSGAFLREMGIPLLKIRLHVDA